MFIIIHIINYICSFFLNIFYFHLYIACFIDLLILVVADDIMLKKKQFFFFFFFFKFTMSILVSVLFGLFGCLFCLLFMLSSLDYLLNCTAPIYSCKVTITVVLFYAALRPYMHLRRPHFFSAARICILRFVDTRG